MEIPTNFWNGTEEDLLDYENEEGKTSEELGGPVDIERLLHDDRKYSPYDPTIGGESLEEMTKSTDELEALIKRLENIDFRSLSTEERNKLRDELLESTKIGI